MRFPEPEIEEVLVREDRGVLFAEQIDDGGNLDLVIRVKGANTDIVGHNPPKSLLPSR